MMASCSEVLLLCNLVKINWCARRDSNSHPLVRSLNILLVFNRMICHRVFSLLNDYRHAERSGELACPHSCPRRTAPRHAMMGLCPSQWIGSAPGDATLSPFRCRIPPSTHATSLTSRLHYQRRPPGNTRGPPTHADAPFHRSSDSHRSPLLYHGPPPPSRASASASYPTWSRW